jgi:hypothetical protein
MDQIDGIGEHRISFEEIDQRYRLKMRAFIKLCMPPVFTDLERRFNLEMLRRRGIVPILFYLNFESRDVPVAFNRMARLTHQVRLCRSVTERPGQGPHERLLLDMRIQVHATSGSGDPSRFGADEGEWPEVDAGHMRALQVLTRPVAPPGERQVIEVPPELSMLAEHPLTEPYPAPEDLSKVPARYIPAPIGPMDHFETVWGLPNTDINQHVNVQEYVYGMENHFSRRLHGTGISLARHRIARAELLFRKPFFAGEAVRVDGPVFMQGAHSLLVGGYHRVDAAGTWDTRPSVAVRMEGVVDTTA